MEPASVLPALERASTVAQIHRVLRDAIVKGRIPAGAQLREAQVARRLGTGRGTVREAIRHLVEEGLVEYALHRGAFVRVLSLADCTDVYRAREAIETWAARKVVESREEFDFSSLQAAIVEMGAREAGEDKPTEDVIAADLRFHHELVRLVGSPRLTRAHETLAAETRMLLRLHPPYPRGTYTSDHQEVLDGLLRRDPNTPDLVAHHLRLSSQLIGEEIEDSGGEIGSAEDEGDGQGVAPEERG